MSDPLRSESARAQASADAEREARIEQLLLAGLDHYFAGEHEQAINVWTRVVFLERGHSRARAYIERARSAVAEHHRESEELLHRGVAAFNRGETAIARDLLTRAVEQGGTHDLALVFLERLNRLGTAPIADPTRLVTPERRPAPRRIETPVTRPRSRVIWVGAGGALGLFAAGWLLLSSTSPLAAWWGDDGAAVPRPQVPAAAPEPVPVPRTSESVIARARGLANSGHLREALRVLDAVTLADPLRPQADRMRADVQRRLLQAGRAGQSFGLSADVRP